MEQPVIETERLCLRKLTEVDLDDMYEYGSNDEVAKYVSWDVHQSKEDTKQFLYRILKQYEQDETYFWAIQLKENRKLIGTIDLFRLAQNIKRQKSAFVYQRLIGVERS